MGGIPGQATRLKERGILAREGMGRERQAIRLGKGRKEETLAFIIESHTTQLYMLATIIHLLAFSLLIVYIFLHILNCFARRNVWIIARFTMEDPPQSQLI